MKEVKVPNIESITHEHAEEFFKFINSTFYTDDKVRLDFSDVKKQKGSVIILLVAHLHIYVEKHKERIATYRLPKNLSRLNGIHTQVNGDDLGWFDEVDDRYLKYLMDGLRKIGINKNNPSYAEKTERLATMMLELISNATEHGKRAGEINYWIGFEKIDKNTIQYTVVDIGIGIAKSHRNSKTHRYRLKSDKQIVESALKGELPSTTNIDGRGLGLPEILEIARSGYVNNFLLISNSALVYLEKNEIKTKDVSNFNGTYFCWTVTKK